MTDRQAPKQNEALKTDAHDNQKRDYQAPKLESFGKLEDITLSGEFGFNDASYGIDPS